MHKNHLNLKDRDCMRGDGATAPAWVIERDSVSEKKKREKEDIKTSESNLTPSAM